MPTERPFDSADTRTKPCRSQSLGKRRKVLFLCTRNSVRSQMAEALLRCLHGDVYEAYSAGVKPDRVHPLVIDVLMEDGIDARGLRSKGVEEMLDHFFDVVVTVCDDARQSCPIYPGGAEVVHHPLSDPSSVDGTPEERLEAFRRLREEIRTWLEAAFGPGSPRYLAPPSGF